MHVYHKIMYLNFQFNGWYIRMRCLHFWIKGSRSSTRVHSPHHSWLQDVATPTILPEESLIEMYTYIRVLVIQGHHLNTTSPHGQRIIVGRINSCSFWVCPHKLTLSAGKHIYSDLYCAPLIIYLLPIP